MAKKITDPAKQARLEIEAALNAKDFSGQKENRGLLRELYRDLKLKRPARALLEISGIDCKNLQLGLEGWIALQKYKVRYLLEIARKQSREGKMHDLHDVLKELRRKK